MAKLPEFFAAFLEPKVVGDSLLFFYTAPDNEKYMLNPSELEPEAYKELLRNVCMAKGTGWVTDALDDCVKNETGERILEICNGATKKDLHKWEHLQGPHHDSTKAGGSTTGKGVFVKVPRHDELHFLLDHTLDGLDLLNATLAKGEVINFFNLLKRKYAKKNGE